MVVSGTWFESLFFFVRPCMYGHARTAMHVWPRESEGTSYVVVTSATRFESFFFSSLLFVFFLAKRQNTLALIDRVRTGP